MLLPRRIALLLALLAGLAHGQMSDPTKPAPPSHPASAPKSPHKSATPVPTFKDIAAEAGLTTSHVASKDKRYVIESMSGGIGVFDCDNDGKLDIVMAMGSSVERYRAGGDLMVTLWHQDADLKFT